MDPLQPNTAPLTPALRALALGLLIENGISLLNRPPEESPVSPGQGERGADGEGELWQALRCKCGELSALVLHAHDPGEAATYVLGYLPNVFEQVYSRERRPVLGGFEAGRQVALRNGWHGAAPASPSPGSKVT
jgi:hypothetical protein